MQSISLLIRVSLALIAILIGADSYAQKILVFDRDGNSKRIRFHVHDEIAVRTGDIWWEGEITDIDDSTIIVQGGMLPVSDINAIRYDTRNSGAMLARRVTAVLPVAAIALLSIYAINAVINNDYPVYSESNLIIAGAFILSKPIVNFLTTHRYKINEHHRLKVIDVSIR